MDIPIDTFQPEKRTLGQLLSSTSPPIRVPDYQRDFSWDKDQVSEFWSDLIVFGGNDPRSKLTGREYFLGAAVLVNNGTYHLLLDGQQRLATSTILLAALRDKMNEFSEDAAKQIQNLYITFHDHLTGERIYKLQLNIFDRAFFRDFVQAFPRLDGVQPTKKSQKLIFEAYNYFQQRIAEGWDAAGGGKKGFEWAAHVAQTLHGHMALVAVVSNNEKSAASIFATLNDRGIGLSTVDLIRSFVLQTAHDSLREEILQCWDETFTACGTTLAAETLIRFSWVSTHGDVKTRGLYKIVSEAFQADTQVIDYSRQLRNDAVLYKQFRDAETDDAELQEWWRAFRTLKFNGAYPLLLAATRVLTSDDQKRITKALIALVIRHNVVCNRDRAKLESVAYAAAKKISDRDELVVVLGELRKLSPSDSEFQASFAKLAFTKTELNIARLLLRAFDAKLSTTEEIFIAGSDRVHVEHIYPQSPKPSNKWTEHDLFVGRLGNLTLLDKKLNEQIQNSDFPTKKQQAYQDSRLVVTNTLVKYSTWSPIQVDERQKELSGVAEAIWPENLV